MFKKGARNTNHSTCALLREIATVAFRTAFVLQWPFLPLGLKFSVAMDHSLLRKRHQLSNRKIHAAQELTLTEKRNAVPGIYQAIVCSARGTEKNGQK